ncbi:MAG: IS1380 family transposase [FCB group bacterium]|nr:IS1380 family transposase [FCB group bacterium]
MKTKYEIQKINATPFGGLYVISEFLHTLGFHDIFQSVFGSFRKIRKFKPSENIALLMAAILSGGSRLYDLEQIARDAVLPELFAEGKVPHDTTVRDDLQKIGQMDQERRELLFQLNERLFNKIELKTITIDIDGTALSVEGHQENAKKGYCPEAPGSRCFQSLSAICDETETCLMEETRSGETHCSNGIIEFCRVLLDRFSPRMDKIIIRLDSGFFSEEFLEFLESYDNVIYEIAVPQKGWVKRQARLVEYKSYHGSEREYTSFGGTKRRHYFERSQLEPGSQPELFDQDRCHYRVVISNDLKRQPHTLFDHYNKRGRDEKHFAELKNEYALGSMVSGDFSVTKALVWVSFLAFTLIGMFRKIALRREFAGYRLRRLRFKLFSAAAYFVDHARQRVLKIAEPLMGNMRFKIILERAWSF